MNTTRYKNNHTVPHHLYQLHLVTRTWKWIDIADESDWGNIQRCVYGDTFANGESDPSDALERIGWGNDSDGHIEIDDVIDLETEKHLVVAEWAKSVWAFADRYAA